MAASKAQQEETKRNKEATADAQTARAEPEQQLPGAGGQTEPLEVKYKAAQSGKEGATIRNLKKSPTRTARLRSTKNNKEPVYVGINDCEIWVPRGLSVNLPEPIYRLLEKGGYIDGVEDQTFTNEYRESHGLETLGNGECIG